MGIDMRIKSYSGREEENQKIEPRGTYFLIFEGTKTEPRYFEAFQNKFSNSRRSIVRNVDIIERDRNEQGLSNPSKIVDLVLSNVESWKENSQITLPGEHSVCYSEDIDEICFLFDRDKKSFTEEQYMYVMQKCAENDFKLCVSNPDFEFWLLLHFDEVVTLSISSLLNNEKENGKTFTEHQLAALTNYSKSMFDTEIFMKRIDRAIENEKSFCEDIDGLLSNVGSNIGLLLTEILGEDDPQWVD